MGKKEKDIKLNIGLKLLNGATVEEVEKEFPGVNRIYVKKINNALRKEYSKDFVDIVKMYNDHSIKTSEACELLNVNEGNFFNMVSIYRFVCKVKELNESTNESCSAKEDNIIVVSEAPKKSKTENTRIKSSNKSKKEHNEVQVQTYNDVIVEDVKSVETPITDMTGWMVYTKKPAVIAGTFRNRHEMPSFVKDFIIDDDHVEDIFNIPYMRSQAHAFILDKIGLELNKSTGEYEAKKDLVLYCTGLGIFVSVIIDICNANNVSLDLMYYNNETYKYEKLDMTSTKKGISNPFDGVFDGIQVEGNIYTKNTLEELKELRNIFLIKRVSRLDNNKNAMVDILISTDESEAYSIFATTCAKIKCTKTLDSLYLEKGTINNVYRKTDLLLRVHNFESSTTYSSMNKKAIE